MHNVAHLGTFEDTTNTNSYPIGPFNPSGGGMIFVGVVTSKGTAPDIPTLTGLGLTWTHITGVVFETSTARIDVYRALAVGATSGNITLSYSDTETGVMVTALQVTGDIITSGTNGADSVVQSLTDSATTGQLPVLSLAAFSKDTNISLGFFGAFNQSVFTAGTNFAIGGQITGTTPGRAIASEYSKGYNDNTVDISRTSTGSGIGGVALEINLSIPTTVYVRSWAWQSSVTSGPFNVPKPGGVEIGTLLLAAGADDTTAGNVISPPAGWTQLKTLDFSSNRTLTVWYRIADASDVAAANYAFSNSAVANSVVSIMSIKNNGLGVPVSAIQSNASASTSQAPSVVTVAPNSLLVCFYHIDNAQALSPPAGMVEDFDVFEGGGTSFAFGAYSQLIASSGATGTRSSSLSVNGPSRAASIAVAPPVTGNKNRMLLGVGG